MVRVVGGSMVVMPRTPALWTIDRSHRPTCSTVRGSTSARATSMVRHRSSPWTRAKASASLASRWDTAATALPTLGTVDLDGGSDDHGWCRDRRAWTLRRLVEVSYRSVHLSSPSADGSISLVKQVA